MEIILTLLKLLVPGLSSTLLEKGVRALQIILTAFAGDEVRREAEIAVVIAELQDGKIPTILEKVIA